MDGVWWGLGLLYFPGGYKINFGSGSKIKEILIVLQKHSLRILVVV